MTYEEAIQQDQERKTRHAERRARSLASCRVNIRSYFSRESNEFERELYVQNLARLHGFEWWELEP